jgi:LEA14-like dessication related protein
MDRMKVVGALVLIVLCAQSCGIYNNVEVLDVQDVRVIEFSDAAIVAEVDLLIENPNWYKVKLIRSEINMKINGADIGRMKLGKKLTIPKKSKAIQTMTIAADYEELQASFLKNFLTLLFNPKVNLQAEGYMKGRALFIGKKIPVMIEEDLDARDFNLGK